MKACGLKNLDSKFFNLYFDPSDKSLEDLKNRVDRINQCISDKGYIMFYPDMCTYHGEELGICN